MACLLVRLATRGALTSVKSSMCNLYSITTNQEAISRLFRVVNRYVGNLPPMTGVFPDYLAPIVRNARRRPRVDHDALPPPPKFGGPPVTSIRTTVVTALARLAEAGKPVPGAGQ